MPTPIIQPCRNRYSSHLCLLIFLELATALRCPEYLPNLVGMGHVMCPLSQGENKLRICLTVHSIPVYSSGCTHCKKAKEKFWLLGLNPFRPFQLSILFQSIPAFVLPSDCEPFKKKCWTELQDAWLWPDYPGQQYGQVSL